MSSASSHRQSGRLVIRQGSPARNHRAFTLIELLCVIAIIAVLGSFLFPATKTMIQRGNNMKCINNLKQLATAAIAAATDNDNRFPKIEIDKDNPIFKPEDNAEPLPKALEKYGITDAVVQCPFDMERKAQSSHTLYGTSYMWLPYSEDETVEAITIYTPRGAFPAKQARVRLATDFEAVHPGLALGEPNSMNCVYADGHVVTVKLPTPRPK